MPCKGKKMLRFAINKIDLSIVNAYSLGKNFLFITLKDRILNIKNNLKWQM